MSRGGACNRCQDPAKRPIGEIVEIVDQLPLRLRLRLRSRLRSRSRGGGPIHGRATDYATVHELLISHDLRKLHDRSLSDRAAPFAKCLMHIAHRARLAARDPTRPAESPIPSLWATRVASLGCRSSKLAEEILRQRLTRFCCGKVALVRYPFQVFWYDGLSVRRHACCWNDWEGWCSACPSQVFDVTNCYEPSSS